MEKAVVSDQWISTALGISIAFVIPSLDLFAQLLASDSVKAVARSYKGWRAVREELGEMTIPEPSQ